MKLKKKENITEKCYSEGGTDNLCFKNIGVGTNMSISPIDTFLNHGRIELATQYKPEYTTCHCMLLSSKQTVILKGLTDYESFVHNSKEFV